MNNNYDKVFSTIKAECERQKGLAEISCFDRIAKKSEVPLTRLPLYLSHLQEVGLIKYSLQDRYIHLTAKGHRHTDPENN